MSEIFNLKNDFLQINVNRIGAELCRIKLLSNGKDYMWNANPEIWAGYSPLLFPIIGALKDDCYFLNGEKYSLPRHGFVRNNSNIELISSTNNCLVFRLKSNEQTLLQYPYQFEFLVSYTLSSNTIIIDHEVCNLGNNDMYFSLGGHPAFKCPIDSNEKYTDYYLEFEQAETAYTYKIESSGLIGAKTDLILNNSRIINLNYHLFNNGALIFKNIKSKKISLCSKISGKRVQVHFEGFPYLGIWAKPNADYVCIEPWLGIADSVNADQKFETKEGIIKLNGNSSFKRAFSISIF